MSPCTNGSPDAPLADSYYRPHDFAGKTVADPFMGGGIKLIEANRLGCDINPMAAWICREAVEHLAPRPRTA